MSEHWAKDAIHILAQHFIISGYPDGTFRPQAAITREEMVFMIIRLLNEESLPQLESMQFNDLSQAGKFAEKAIISEAKAGIISDYPDDTFRPKGIMTRAETIVILHNLLTIEPRIKEQLAL